MMNQLQIPFDGVNQHNGKLRMLIDYKNVKNTQNINLNAINW